MKKNWVFPTNRAGPTPPATNAPTWKPTIHRFFTSAPLSASDAFPTPTLRLGLVRHRPTGTKAGAFVLPQPPPARTRGANERHSAIDPVTEQRTVWQRKKSPLSKDFGIGRGREGRKGRTWRRLEGQGRDLVSLSSLASLLRFWNNCSYSWGNLPLSPHFTATLCEWFLRFSNPFTSFLPFLLQVKKMKLL